jgi:CRISPR-associated protein Csm1
MDKNIGEIVLGAFFHDVGKFIQRSESFKEKHEILSAYFAKVVKLKTKNLLRDEIDWELVAKLAYAHHEQVDDNYLDNQDFSKKLAIIKKADNIAAATQRAIIDAIKENAEEINQKDIFSYLYQEGNKISMEYYHKIHPLYQMEDFMPVKKDEITTNENIQAYNSWLGKDNLGYFLEKLFQPDGKKRSLLSFLYGLDDVFHLFYTQIPEDRRDIYQLNSLYDHLKLTTLFAFLLYYGENFYPLAFDIGGIQKFIFDIKAKKAAKILRGRSLFIQIITDTIAHYLISNLKLIPQTVIFNYGGNTLMFLPEKEKILDQLESLLIEINKKLLINFGLTIRINDYKTPLLLTEATIKELFDEKSKVSKKVGKKNLPTKSFFELYEWNNEIAVKNVDDSSLCDFCDNPHTNIFEEMKFCNNCRLFFDLSNKIIKNQIFAFDWERLKLVDDPKTESDNLIFFKPYKNLIRQKESKLNFFPNSSSKTLFYTITNANGKSFEDIVDNKETAPLLLYLKGDVDNMSKILSEGFNFRDKTVLTDKIHFSRRINIFFQNYIPYFIEKDNKYKENIYIVFSGGDDFFLVGHWETVFEFIFKLKEEFEKFKCNNEKITFSIGGYLAKPHDPIYLIAEKTEEKLAEAKKTKNSFAFLHSSLPFDGWNKIKEIAEKIKESEVSNSFLYKVFLLADYLKDPKKDYHKTVALQKIQYYFYRMVDNKDFRNNQANEPFIEFFEQILKIPQEDDENLKFNIINLKTIINLIMLYRRKKRR